MKIKVIALITFALVFFTTAVSAQVKKHMHHSSMAQNKLIRHRIVFQLSTADTLEQRGMVNNLKHIKEGWGDSVLVEVVVHGPGIEMLTKGKTAYSETIQQLISQGIHFVVCRNTMKQRNITEDQILPDAGFVPSGVREIIMKEEEGWSYLKAGF